MSGPDCELLLLLEDYYHHLVTVIVFSSQVIIDTCINTFYIIFNMNVAVQYRVKIKLNEFGLQKNA